MLFNYQVLDQRGEKTAGSIEAISVDVAISSLQRRGFTIVSVAPADSESLFKKKLNFFGRIRNKDIVLLSRQLATLFQAQVSALRVFRLLATESDRPALRDVLVEVADDLQAGSAISKALGKHPEAFSDFYVNMVRAGEEAGKLNETFGYLADYLERTYEVVSKTKNALVYPFMVLFVFLAVMILMLVVVIPNLSKILLESGQEIPVYTRIVIGTSDFFTNYGAFLLVAIAVGGFFLWRWVHTPLGELAFSRFKITVPYIGSLYRKLYLSRVADNMHTMLVSAIPILKTLEITATVVENAVYRNVLNETMEGVKSGNSVSDAFSRHPEIPGIMVQMMKVGEETGELGGILETLARFYTQEVKNAVDTLISLIEPLLIIVLGLGVAFLLASILIPIYNISSAQ